MSERACIGLGSNLGDRHATLDEAIAALRATAGSAALVASRYHFTAPVGGPPGQGPFLNAAATFDTSLSPTDLLRQLQAIEADAGRVRRERWGERSLDLDLLLFGNLSLDSEDLSVPHPRMAVRRFVLEPLAEIAPEAFDPGTGRTVLDLLRNLDRRPRVVTLIGWSQSDLAAIVPAIPPAWTTGTSPDGRLAGPPGAAPTFLAVPERWKSQRSALLRSWPAGTPILFVPERDPAEEIRAACLAATMS